MVEWSITPVLKTGVPRGTGGSNPSLSATMRKTSLVGVFLHCNLISSFSALPRATLEVIVLNGLVGLLHASLEGTKTEGHSEP